MSVTIQPVEDMMWAGFQSRFQQVFNCPVIYTTATDKMKVLAAMLDNKPPVYPYAFVTIQSIGPNKESYASNSLARRGLVTTVGDGMAYRVRLMPAKFELEIEYMTNEFQSTASGSVLAFIRNWIFAARQGTLKFNINYGRLAISIGAILSDTPSIPLRENVVEQETLYKIVGNVTLSGWVSQPELGTVGVIKGLEVNGVPLNPDGSVPGSQFFAFDQIIKE